MRGVQRGKRGSLLCWWTSIIPLLGGRVDCVVSGCLIWTSLCRFSWLRRIYSRICLVEGWIVLQVDVSFTLHCACSVFLAYAGYIPGSVWWKSGLCCKWMSHLLFIVSVSMAYAGYIPEFVWWKGGLCCKWTSHLLFIVSVSMAYAGYIPGSVWFAS